MKTVVLQPKNFLLKMYEIIGRAFGGSSQVPKEIILSGILGQENNNSSGQNRAEEWYNGFGMDRYYRGRPIGWLSIPYYIHDDSTYYECYSTRCELETCLNQEDFWED